LEEAECLEAAAAREEVEVAHKRSKAAELRRIPINEPHYTREQWERMKERQFNMGFRRGGEKLEKELIQSQDIHVPDSLTHVELNSWLLVRKALDNLDITRLLAT